MARKSVPAKQTPAPAPAPTNAGAAFTGLKFADTEIVQTVTGRTRYPNPFADEVAKVAGWMETNPVKARQFPCTADSVKTATNLLRKAARDLDTPVSLVIKYDESTGMLAFRAKPKVTRARTA